MTIGEQKEIANIISDALIAYEHKELFDKFFFKFKGRDMPENHSIMRLVLLYYNTKTGQEERRRVSLKQREILEPLNALNIIEHIGKNEVITECKKSFEEYPNRDSLIYLIDRVIDIANMAYTRGYEDGQKEVEHIDW